MSIIDEIKTEQSMLMYDGEDRLEIASIVVEADKKNRPTGEAIKSGLPRLDETLKGGFYPGQLVVVSGTTGHGKTTLCRTFTANMIQDKRMAIWLSYELMPAEFSQAFKEDELKQFVMPMKMKSQNIPWIEQKIVEGKMKYNGSVLFIDHLHRIVDLHGRQNVSTQIGQAVSSCKELALKHNMVIFLVCHTMKTKPDSDEELDIGSVRDSSLIEQEADTVLYTWRYKPDTSVNILKVAKNRKGGQIGTTIPLVFMSGCYAEKADALQTGTVDKRDEYRVGKRRQNDFPQEPDNGRYS